MGGFPPKASKPLDGWKGTGRSLTVVLSMAVAKVASAFIQRRADSWRLPQAQADESTRLQFKISADLPAHRGRPAHPQGRRIAERRRAQLRHSGVRHEICAHGTHRA